MESRWIGDRKTQSTGSTKACENVKGGNDMD